jgi:hypothetical protein
MLDWSVNLGNLITVATVVGSILLGLGMLKARVRELGERMLAVEKNMERLVEVLVEQGRHEERMNSIDGRMLAQGARIDDLSRQLNRFFAPKIED